jgi:hypothetical protein
VDQAKKILTQKKGGLQVQAYAPGPIISCIFFFKERIGKRHVAYCGRRLVVCHPIFRPPCDGHEIETMGFFIQKYQLISTTKTLSTHQETNLSTS